MEAQHTAASSSSGRRRRAGRRAERQEEDALVMTSFGCGHGGKGTLGKDVAVVHHRPPKETAADVGYPVRGGQTLLIAYFPWEASEGDIEHEFAKFCRVKRVHLVVDKSSRKPRCFGFVKFVSKGDAEEALRATTMGMVQLPDTRGHVWHLKAEWTKSGDMVVDDSETEQEVAKRKEERKGSRADQRAVDVLSKDTAKGQEARSKSSRWPPQSHKGSLHSAMPPSLPSLYPTMPTLGLQGQMPWSQPGPPGVPPLLPQHAASPLPVGPPQQHNYGLVPGGVQQSLPMYSSYGGPPPAVPPYPIGLPGAPLPAVAPRAPIVPDIPHPGMPQLPLRDLLGSTSPGMPHQAYGGGYPPPGGYGPPPPPQAGFMGGQGYPPGHSPYAGHNATAYTGQQAYASNTPAYPGGPHQEPYPTAPTYPSAYAPHHPGIPSQPGYAQPPSYAAQVPGYGAPHMAGQNASYSSTAHPSYTAGAYGVGQQGLIHPGTHAHPQGTYPGHMPPATGLQQHPVQPQQLDETMSLATTSAGGLYGPPTHQDNGYGALQNGMAAHMMMVPNTHTGPQVVGSPPQVTQEPSLHHDPGEVVTHTSIANTQALAVTSNATTGVAPGQEYLHDVFMHFPDMSMHDKNNAVVTSVPAPPPQQPPAPPAMQVPPASGQWQAESFREVPSVHPAQHQPTPQGPQDWNVPATTVATTGQSVRPPAPGGTGPPSLWTTFDDAAKGMDRMVDGLVGEDGLSPPNAPWAVHAPSA